MGRRKNKRVRALVQRGQSWQDARAQVQQETRQRKPYRLVDSVTNQEITTLSVRKSRATKRVRMLLGDDARLEHE